MMVHVIYDLVCISIRICDKNTETLQRFRRLHRERLFNFLFSRSKNLITHKLFCVNQSFDWAWMAFFKMNFTLICNMIWDVKHIRLER